MPVGSTCVCVCLLRNLQAQGVCCVYVYVCMCVHVYVYTFVLCMSVIVRLVGGVSHDDEGAALEQRKEHVLEERIAEAEIQDRLAGSGRQ